MAELASNIDDWAQQLYGTPPPENTDPSQMLVNETLIDWQLVKRLYAADRFNEDAYNASISFEQEATAFPTFTRDYVVRRYNFTPKAKLTALSGIVAATVTAGGSGYTPNTVSVSLTGGTGSGGAVTAIISDGKVVALAITQVGNYTVPPTLTINDSGSGSGATGVCAVQPQTALLTKEDALRQPENPLDGLFIFVRRVYDTLPGPILSGTHTDEETGIVTAYSKQIVAAGTVTSGKVGSTVTGLVLISGGTGFTGTPTLVFSGGGGTGAAGTATVTAPSPAGKLATLNLTNGGAGYTSPPTVAITDGGPGTGAFGVANLTPTIITSIPLTFGGSGFSDPPLVTITDTGSGQAATAIAILAGTTVDSVLSTAVGSGYSMATVNVTGGGGGTGLDISAVLTGDQVTSYTINNAGLGYTLQPILTITGDGTGATAEALLTGTSVASIQLTSTGFLYQNPSVLVDGGGGTGATANALLSPTTIQSLTITAPGSGYASPAVAFTGGGGSGATATATVSSGTITSLALTNAGSNYTEAPMITTSGGGGSGAIIMATIGSITYVEEEPVTSVKSIKMSSSIVLSSLPSDKSYPVSFRVKFVDRIAAGLISASGEFGIDWGMVEAGFNGGSGPVLAQGWERYMTESEYQAFKSAFQFSITGNSIVTTLVAEAVNNGYPRVWTFRPQPIYGGTSMGTVDLSADILRYGIRKVKEIVLTKNY